jgi:HSP20 family protein
MNTETKQVVPVSTKASTEIGEPRPLQMFGPLEEVERLFDRLMPRAWMRPMGWGWPSWGGFDESLENTRVAQLDVIDRDKEFLVRVEMPGVDKKDVDVSITDSTLNIKGSLSRESKEQKKGYIRSEITCSNFARRLALPSGVDTHNISASLKDGILEVILPKEASVQRRAVEVK